MSYKNSGNPAGAGSVRDDEVEGFSPDFESETEDFMVCQERLFRELDEGEHPDARRRYLERIRTVMKYKYRVTDKFGLIASLLCPESADEDVEHFKRAKDDRDKLLHGQDVHEAGLPVQAMQELLRRYLHLHFAMYS